MDFVQWLADLLVDIVNWFVSIISMFTTWINSVWAWIISPLYTPLSDYLPSVPEIREVARWLSESDASFWVSMVWWIADQVLVANVVAAAFGALLGVMMIVWLYRAWMVIKRAVPVVG